jgi:quercetin dioxygenase-like cupin family protein
MNEILKNPITGDQMEFIRTAKETNGELCEFILTMAPKSDWAKSPKHFHSHQTETFKVLSGELHLYENKKLHILTPDSEKVVIGKQVPHAFWNPLESETVLQAEIYPVKEIEKGLRYTYELAQRGKLNKRNIPYNPFYSFILMSYVDSYFVGIPWKFQKAIWLFGAKLSRLLGYK